MAGRQVAFAGSLVVIAAGAFWFVQRVFFPACERSGITAAGLTSNRRQLRRLLDSVQYPCYRNSPISKEELHEADNRLGALIGVGALSMRWRDSRPRRVRVVTARLAPTERPRRRPGPRAGSAAGARHR